MLEMNTLEGVLNSILDYDIIQLKDFLWGADINYDIERTIDNLIEFHSFFDISKLEVDDITKLVEYYFRDYEVSELIDNIKYLEYKDKNEITLKQYNEKILVWMDLNKDSLKNECRYYGLPTSGTKTELVERLMEELTERFDIIN